MFSRTRRRLQAVAFAVGSLLILTACGNIAHGGATYSESADRPGPTVIGADNSAESRIVAALYVELLTAAGQKVQTATTGYASAADTAQAVVSGRLSIAPAYESTMLRALPGGQTMPGDMEATLSMALPPGIVALPAAAAQRGIVLAVPRATARRHGLRSLADLAEGDRHLTLGGAASGSPDTPSVSSLKKAYGVTFTSAGTSKTADVLVLRSTDPAIARDGLAVLTDPKGVVSPEHVFPLASAAYMDVTARQALARINRLLTTDQLAALTASVNGGEAPSKVAKAWLGSKDLPSAQSQASVINGGFAALGGSPQQNR